MIKSNNPHLAGGEIYIYICCMYVMNHYLVYIYTYLLRINIMHGKIWIAVYK